MKILIVDILGEALDLAMKLQDEGNDVRLHIRNKMDKDIGDGIIPKVSAWNRYIGWADLIVFCDVGFGNMPKKLRERGKSVVGGTAVTDKMENDREFGMRMCEMCGIPVPKYHIFDSFGNVRKFLDENKKKRYVFKPFGQMPRQLTKVLNPETQNRTLQYLEDTLQGKNQFMLQEFIEGIEMAIGGWFNGKKFLRPVLPNFEYKKLMDGDLGPNTGEMGNIMIYKDKNKLFSETLAKASHLLEAEKYVGYVDLNCVLTDKGPYAIEWTCYDDETEIFTDEGWKLFRDLNQNEQVATLDPNTNTVEWNRPYDYQEFDYVGDLIQFGNSALEARVTPNHWMYKKDRNDETGFVQARDFPQGSCIVRTAQWNEDVKETYTIPEYIEHHHTGRHHTTFPIVHKAKTMPMDIWLKFLGLYISEGSMSGDRHISISQHTTKNREIIEEWLKDFPVELRKYGNGFQLNSIQLGNHILNLGLAVHCNEKHIPTQFKQLSEGQIKILLESLILGDGSVHKRTSQRSYYTTSKQLADDIQELFMRIGNVANIKRNETKGTKTVINGEEYIRNFDGYSISERTTKKDYYVDSRNTNLIPYNGKVYCVTVNNHIILVRRNGKAYWCGQTRFGYPTISVQDEIHKDPWGSFLMALANASTSAFKSRKNNWCVGIAVVTLPWPLETNTDKYKNVPIFIRGNSDHIHLSDAKLKDGELVTAGNVGYVAVATGHGRTLETAIDYANKRAEQVIVDDGYFRSDIGYRTLEHLPIIKRWGYLSR